MKNIQALLFDLAERNIVIVAQGDRLKVNAPKGAMTSNLAEQIKQNKGEITRFLARAQIKQQSIPRVPRNQDIPLSFAQQRLWFLDQLENGTATYNVPLANHVTGDLDVVALRYALDAIVARHEALRTCFRLKENGPVQVIQEQAALSIQITDLSAQFSEDDGFGDGQADHAGQKWLRELIYEQARLPFDLEQGPMLRVSLYRLSPRSMVFMVNMHHIVADGWSLDVIMNELTVLYQSFRKGTSVPLSPLPVQYADYSIWQRNRLTGERLTALQDYWTVQLHDLPPLLELPTDFPRPAVQSFQGALDWIEIPKPLTDRLARFSKAEGATMFMTMMAVFNLLLARLSGQKDLAVGSPIANRDHMETEALIGYFANTFVLRTQLCLDSSFRQLLGQVCVQTRQAYDHQELPFEHLVDQLAPERSLSYSPLFQVMFTLKEPTQTHQQEDLGWQMTPIHPGSATSKFDLTLNLTLTSGGIRGFLEYSTALFMPETIQRWFSYYLLLLDGVVNEPDREMGKLALVSDGEREQILRTWNQTQRPFSGVACIHQHFEVQAQKTPSEIAVLFDPMLGDSGEGVVRLTYQALDRRANQVAHELRHRGLGPDHRVGLCLDRSLDMVVGMLGILKAGAAYVPLDPAYPAERLAYMLENADVKLMITSPDAALRPPQGVTALPINRPLLDHRPETPVASGVSSENLLYVIYTSGSTGRPKGIALSHGALVNLIQWHLEELPEPGAVLQFASMSFDASFHEIFAAWNSGNSLLLVPEALRYDCTKLPQLLDFHQVRKVILPVVVLQQLTELFPQGSPLLQALTHVITTGEQLQVTRPMVQFFQSLHQTRLHNHYGPAEAHVVTAYRFGRDPSAWGYHAPVGYPIANTQIHILDSCLEPVPQGVKGHLYIGGANLARGYLARPALTAEKFVPNAHGQPGSRLYATGDLARYLNGGNIEFLGRADHMIKIRGFRVEPGELEAVLTSDPRVNRAIALAHGNGSQEKRLVAYVVLEGTFEGAAEVLRGVVAQQLPEHMVPSAFVFLDEMPLSPTGKVDRKALPAPDFATMSSEDKVLPRNDIEVELQASWAAILQVDPGKIGVHHNFFDLGGHSLLATRLISRVRNDFQLEIPLRALFVSPTIAGLAEEIQNRRWLLTGPGEENEPATYFEEVL